MNGGSTVLSGLFAGRYEIERELGRGGTAIVYLARDLNRGHAVAIKLLKHELAESMAAERFLREIRLSEQLHHPHLLPVLDSGDQDGRLYFVLPHMEGGTLRARLQRETQLPLIDTIKITRSIANALTYAHEKGLVHRDVKPENILFTSGEACLSDFGIARALEHALGVSTTSTSVVRGTPLYMSPEQASGRSTYDGRSDIYSLGCVVYEMLAGIQPYVGPTPESVMAQKVTQPPRPLRDYRPAIPKAVERVIARALAISPADRFQTASEFADALDVASRTPDSIYTRARLRRWFIVGAGVTLAVIATSFALRPRQRPAASDGIPEGDPRRLAVLYFDDLSPATLPPHIADGISEDLIDQLGAVRALHVISPNGVRQFRGSSAPLDSVARALKVGTIVSGSVARSGSTMRVNVRLVDAKSGRQLYSMPLEQPWTELFALQDKLASQVAFFLRQRLGDAIALRAHQNATESIAAWELAQEGGEMVARAADLELRNDPRQPQLLLDADARYARAEQEDRSWPYPTVKRGGVALMLAMQRVPPAPAAPDSPDSALFARMTVQEQRSFWFTRSLRFADEAVRRAPRSPEALTLRANALYTQVSFGLADIDSLAPVIERDLRSALEIRPSLATAWSILASFYRTQGRFLESANAAQHAFDADAYFEVRRTVSVAFFSSLHAEQFEDARRWCRLGLQHYDNDPRFAECELTLLGWTGRGRNDVTAAWQQLHRIERRDTLGMLTPTWEYRRLMVAAILARGGMPDSARAIMRTVDERSRSGSAPDARTRSSAIPEAYLRLLLNDRDGAIARIAELLRVAPQARPYVAQHPWLRPLHNDPRFLTLTRQDR